MAMSFNFCGGTTLSVFVNGKSYTFDKDSPNFKKVLKAVREGDEQKVMEFVLVENSVKAYVGKDVEIKDGVIFYMGEELRNAITQKIFCLMELDLPVEGMVKFLSNYMKNPSFNSREQLNMFLENKNLPITEDGCFLAYKRVQDDWTDFHTGTHLHEVGKVLEMSRTNVDDNPNNHCSHGFHAGAMEYVKDFHPGQGHVVIVKINPKDVVSVPTDCSCQKLRTCRYEVVGEYTGDLTCPMYRANVNDVTPCESDWDEEDY